MRLSIIVCTRNRAHAIVKCLDSIAASLFAAAPVDAEIVVVDNASTDNTTLTVQKWAETCSFPVNLVFEAKKGLSAARNCGIRAARGNLFAFTDDDCCLKKDYVSVALSYDKQDRIPVLRGGRVELGDSTDLPLTTQTNPNRLRWHRSSANPRPSHLGGGIIPGCNMLMRRAVIDRLGWFDERLGAGSSVPAGEDTDYIFRAYLADIPIEYVPDMTVYHFHGRKDLAEGKQLIRNYVLGTGALYVKFNVRHPNLCHSILAVGEKIFMERKKVKMNAPLDENFISATSFSMKTKIIYCLEGGGLYLLSLFRKSE